MQQASKSSVATLVLGIAAASLVLWYMNDRPRGADRLPDFSLPSLKDTERVVSPQTLLERPALVNFWASWCLACRTEHTLLLELAETKQIPLYGVNFLDKRGDAIRWLDYYGDPYIVSAHDIEGSLGHAMGAEALPVTYLVGIDGEILYTHIGPLSRTLLEQSIMPKIIQSERAQE